MGSRATPLRFAILLLAAAAGLLSPRAEAQVSLPDLASLADPTVNAVKDEIIRTMGVGFDHRPYQSATPLGTAAGVDLSLEFTLSRVPPSFKEALTSVGLEGASQLPVIPSPKLHLHKGMGERLDIGGSGIAYQGYLTLGADIKTTISTPDAEGPTVALRLNYNYVKIQYVKSHTWTPQVLISKKMEFADPYLGLGYQIVNGSLNLSFDFPAPIGTITREYKGSGGSFLAFLGIGFRPPQMGLKLTLEGAYSGIGAHSLGVKFGFAF